eukprot:SM000003S11159  [mRNA]  locus=s3:1337807:1341689:+ [translate_table: standard]
MDALSPIKQSGTFNVHTYGGLAGIGALPIPDVFTSPPRAASAAAARRRCRSDAWKELPPPTFDPASPVRDCRGGHARAGGASREDDPRPVKTEMEAPLTLPPNTEAAAPAAAPTTAAALKRKSKKARGAEAMTAAAILRRDGLGFAPSETSSDDPSATGGVHVFVGVAHYALARHPLDGLDVDGDEADEDGAVVPVAAAQVAAADDESDEQRPALQCGAAAARVRRRCLTPSFESEAPLPSRRHSSGGGTVAIVGGGSRAVLAEPALQQAEAEAALLPPADIDAPPHASPETPATGSSGSNGGGDVGGGGNSLPVAAPAPALAPAPRAFALTPGGARRLVLHRERGLSLDSTCTGRLALPLAPDGGSGARGDSPPSKAKKKRPKAAPSAAGSSGSGGHGAGEGCRRCHCRKSKCLKLYCECFTAGVSCEGPGCACVGCLNRPEFAAAVAEARAGVLQRDPRAFDPKIRMASAGNGGGGGASSDGKVEEADVPRHKKGCNCKKSLCTKRYCECYQAGVGCMEGCHCEGCQNVFGRKDECGSTGGRNGGAARKGSPDGGSVGAATSGSWLGDELGGLLSPTSPSSLAYSGSTETWPSSETRPGPAADAWTSAAAAAAAAELDPASCSRLLAASLGSISPRKGGHVMTGGGFVAALLSPPSQGTSTLSQLCTPGCGSRAGLSSSRASHGCGSSEPFWDPLASLGTLTPLCQTPQRPSAANADLSTAAEAGAGQLVASGARMLAGVQAFGDQALFREPAPKLRKSRSCSAAAGLELCELAAVAAPPRVEASTYSPLIAPLRSLPVKAEAVAVAEAMDYLLRNPDNNDTDGCNGPSAVEVGPGATGAVTVRSSPSRKRVSLDGDTAPSGGSGGAAETSNGGGPCLARSGSQGASPGCAGSGAWRRFVLRALPALPAVASGGGSSGSPPPPPPAQAGGASLATGTGRGGHWEVVLRVK